MDVGSKKLAFSRMLTAFFNLVFVYALILMFFVPDLFKKYPMVFYFTFQVVAVAYYVVFVIFLYHYTSGLVGWVRDHRAFFSMLLWIGAYLLAFIGFYLYVHKEVALELFGGGLVLYLLKGISDSFTKWRKKKNSLPPQKSE